MIKAKKNILLQTLMSVYVEQLLKRSFQQMHWYAPCPLPSTPVIFIANHSSWWDGPILYYLSRKKLPQDIYFLMHEKGLRDYPYFRQLGAFSVNRDHPKEILRTIQYAASLLKDQKSVWLFPQGDEFPMAKRPLQFQSGIIRIWETKRDIPIIPICYHYAFESTKKPNVYVMAGCPIRYDDVEGKSRKEKINHLEQLYTDQLDHFNNVIMTKQHVGFTKM